MSSLDPHAFGPAIAQLLTRPDMCSLGPGSPAVSIRPLLASLDAHSLSSHQPLVDYDMAQCCISGLWLLHDFLDESHGISQGIPTRSGSYWHGIMHRREGDHANAKYWFRRVGHHPVLDVLWRAAAPLAERAAAGPDAEFLVEQRQWDPFRFVDFCEAVTESGSEAEALGRQIAQLEWQLLFDFCHRKALGLG